MKKNFLLGFIAFAAMAVTSCTNDELNEFIPQEKAIEFSTYLGRDAQSRASVQTAETLKNGFGVMAYFYKLPADVDYTTTPNFMNNVQVYDTDNLSNTGTFSWTYDVAKYWPTDTDNELIDFLAYGPYSEDDTNVAVNGKDLTFTVNDAIDSQTDLVVATPKTGQTSLTNSGTVEFSFSHMLSRVAFYAKTAASYSGTTIKVTGITLNGKFYQTGTVDLSAATPAITGTDDTNYEVKDFTLETSQLNDVTLNNSGFNQINNDNNYLMVIPDAVEQDLKLSITYTTTYSEGATATTTTTPVTIEDFAFDAGIAYAFNMSIQLTGKIEFSVTVTSWPSETTVTVPTF